MALTANLFLGEVMHKRYLPKENAFKYRIYYLDLPLKALDNTTALAIERFAPISFYRKDHGRRDGSDLEAWARAVLAEHHLDVADGEISLMTMPRVLGYVFNPVSFWFCHDQSGQLRAVLCEVNNTFGENHTYLCAHQDHHPIHESDVLTGQKDFYVSPFLARNGHYTFRFKKRQQRCDIWINYYNEEGHLQLATSLNGVFKALNKKNLRQAFWRHPLVTFKSIFLIHWQALKLVIKSARYFKRPPQKAKRVSTTKKVNKR